MELASRKFGRFVLIDRVATGRACEVMLARMRGPEQFNKLVAIKRIRVSGEEAPARTFVEEGSIAAQLGHPHIAQVFEMGEAQGYCYMVMEYVAGKSLQHLLSRTKGKLAPAHVAEIFAQLCSALAYAHDAGIVHRDVQPANVLVSYSGSVKLIDFGSARSDEFDRTQIGGVEKRVPYMSPEQCVGKLVDARSDVFSAGVCLYEALTGRNPFSNENPVEAMEAVCRRKAAPVSSYDRSLAAFDTILTVALAKDPRRRFPDCRAMQQALEPLARTLPAERTLASVMRRRFTDEVNTERRRKESSDARTTLGVRSLITQKRAIWVAIGALALTIIATAAVTVPWLG